MKLETIHVLVADPDIQKNSELTSSLRKFGVAHVTEVSTPGKVIQAAETSEPDLIILGDSFPGLSTEQLLRDIKKIKKFEDTPTLIYSRSIKAATTRKVVGIGVVGTIPYPLEECGLERALANFFRREEGRGLAHLIKESWFFRHFSSTEIKALMKCAVTRRFQAGETIVRRSDPPDCFYVLMEGEAEAFLLESERRHVAIPIKTGECFGEMAILQSCGRSADCLAKTDCLVLEIGSHVILDKSYKLTLHIYARLAQILAQRLEVMNRYIMETIASTPKTVRTPFEKPMELEKKIQKPAPKPAETAVAKPEKEAEITPEPALSSKQEKETPDNVHEGLDIEAFLSKSGCETKSGPDEKVNPFGKPTAIAENIDKSVVLQEDYEVLKKKIGLRSQFIFQKIPRAVRESIQNRMFGYWTGGKLARLNPHKLWNPKLFTPSSTHLKKSMHMIVVCPTGFEQYKKAYLDLPFSHSVVSMPEVGCAGTFLGSPSAIERFFLGRSLETAITHDLAIGIDRTWRGADCIEFLTHTLEDVRPATLFLVFDDKEGQYTHMVRSCVPEHQIVTIIEGIEIFHENPASMFAVTEEYLKDEELICPKKEWNGVGYYLGETCFLSDLAPYYENSNLEYCGSVFGTMAVFAQIGPDYSGSNWGSKGGAEGALRAARARYGFAGAQSAAEIADAISWADQ